MSEIPHSAHRIKSPSKNAVPDERVNAARGGLADFADPATTAIFAEWFDGQIENIYTRLSDGKSATDIDNSGSTKDSGRSGN